MEIIRPAMIVFRSAIIASRYANIVKLLAMVEKKPAVIVF